MQFLLQFRVDRLSIPVAYHYPVQSLLLEGVTLRVNAITEPVCRIKMCIPLYIDRTDAAGTTALSPFDPDFFRLIEQNAARKYQAFTGQMAQGIEFRALAVDEARNKEVTRYIGSRMLTAWFGLYRLRGTPEELSFLYEAGLGAKNAAGFGMFGKRPVSAQRSHVTKIYEAPDSIDLPPVK